MALPVEVATMLKEECSQLVRSPDFRRSPVMSRLLEFLVDFCITQDSRGPKAYTVAVEGLGRSSDFDPNVDSYPRVQVGRLRKMLVIYYAQHPRSQRIDIPVGHYKVELADCRDDIALLGHATSASAGSNILGGIRNRLGLERRPGLTWALVLLIVGTGLGALVAGAFAAN